MTPYERAIQDLTRRLTDEGKLIEVGFVTLRAVAMHPEAPADQVKEMRMAFFAGAQHLFGSIMGFLESGDEITDKDMRRMSLVDAELTEFIDEFSKQHNLPPRPTT
jgi:hypothetical protein